MYCASHIYTFQQLAWQQFIKHFIANIFFGSAETEVSSLTGSQTWYSNVSNSQRRQWHHMLHIAGNNDSRQRTDKAETKNQTMELIPSHHNRHMRGSSALLEACHQRERQRLHCTKDKQRTFHYITFWLCHCVHNNFTENPRNPRLKRQNNWCFAYGEGRSHGTQPY